MGRKTNSLKNSQNPSSIRSGSLPNSGEVYYEFDSEKPALPRISTADYDAA
jgi:hypothetical protein